MHGDFINDQIFIEGLPMLEEVEFQKLQGSYKYVMLLRAVASIIVIFLGLTIFISLFTGWSFKIFIFGYGTLILYGIATLIFRYLAFYKKGYAVRSRDITYKTGLFWKREIVVPFSRIQHCEIKEGPIDSLLDLARLEIYTAGGSGSNMSIPGLSPSEAMVLRGLIIKETALDEEE